MDKLRIENFGPIISAELELRKYNIIIGPQGSGKSCILKIASFCKWLEKVYISGEYQELIDGISSKQFVEKYLLEFYKLEDYAKVRDCQLSKITFAAKSNVSFSISFNPRTDEWIDISGKSFSQKPHRVSYIPAERFLASAFISLLEIKINQNTNIYKFLIDWEISRCSYNENRKYQILNLNSSFFHDEKSKTDYIYINNDIDGIAKEIKFTNSSSGFQSIVPLCILIEHYLNKEKTLSLAENKRVKELQSIIDSILKNSDSINKQQIINAIQNISETSGSAIFLEEPEANIFPETQYELVKWIVKTMSNGKDNSIFIATHSPYILSSFNNLILAGETVSNNADTVENVETITQSKHFVNFDEISVYEVNDCRVKPIKDDELRIIDTNSIDSVSNEINEQFSKMLDL